MSSIKQELIMSSTKLELAYRQDIDGLRAIAILLVVGFHYFGVKGGFVGVDIFFVISEIGRASCRERV